MTPRRQHAGLSAERWAEFSFAEQVLMIGNEMNRGLRQLEAEAWDRGRGSYERVLQLVDLTVGLRLRRPRRRELLRWRDLVAALWLDERPAVGVHVEVFRCLLQLTPEAARQIDELPALARRH